jgi:Mlc titration factor MtfA (ptsG expression regulator)
MVWSPFLWWRDRRRARLLARPLSPVGRQTLESLPFWRTLDEDERDRCTRIARLLVAEKEWEGCGGLEITEAIRFTIAAQAAVLVMHRPESEWFPRVASILVYPSAYRNPLPRVDATGVVSIGTANLGEAWQRGPVVLAWDDVRRGVARPGDGRNLVLHEFAHKLDMLDGYADGSPPLSTRAEHRRWHDVMTVEFEQLRRAAEDGRATILDTYGAVNPAEFFAVVTEAFFERGPELRREHPALYAALADYYRQDPANRAL